MAFFLCLFVQSSFALVVEPSRLEFETRLDDPILLSLTVDLADIQPKNFTVDIEGFPTDRRVTPIGDGKFLVQVAPDTDSPGNVRGNVILKNDGRAIGDPIPVSGTIFPWISIRPAKLFLGSIGHGGEFKIARKFAVTLTSDNSPFDIKKVDFSEIQEASWVCDPPVGTPALTKRLELTFSPDALGAGFPYGALARKLILVETTHPRASVLSIPVMGMLSVNTTGRDYSQYLYKGELRWQGPWPTPNNAAAFLATGTILLCGIGCALHNKLPVGFKWPATALFFAAMSAGCFYLAKTYSRGGWLSLGAGIVILVVAIRRPRWYPILLAAVFGLSIALNPAGLNRAASAGEVTADKSISHRLLLWQGALQMMAEHPWTGVGTGKFGDVFMRDYQLPGHTQSYSTAINDFLTIGTERGIPALSLVVSFFLFLGGMGIWVGMKHANPFLVGCGASIFSSLIGSWFSSIVFQSNPAWLLVAASIGVLAGVAWYWVSNRRKKQQHFYHAVCSSFRWTALLWVALAILVAGTCVIAGLLAHRNRPVIEPIRMAGCEGVVVAPRWKQPKGTIFYIGDRGQKPVELVKSTLRPLAQLGWEVFAFEQPDYPSDACLQMASVLLDVIKPHSREINRVVAGHNQGAQVALALATSPYVKGVACFRLRRASAFSDISPDQRINELKKPLLLCSQQADLGRSLPASQVQFQNDMNTAASYKHIIFHGEFCQENRDWQLWIHALDKGCFSHADADVE